MSWIPSVEAEVVGIGDRGTEEGSSVSEEWFERFQESSDSLFFSFASQGHVELPSSGASCM